MAVCCVFERLLTPTEGAVPPARALQAFQGQVVPRGGLTLRTGTALGENIVQLHDRSTEAIRALQVHLHTGPALLRRLRLHGLNERLPHTHRYRLTEHGLKSAMFYSRVYNRVLRPGMSLLNPTDNQPGNALHRRFNAMNEAINTFCDQAKVAA